jgi:outer membrane protein
VTLNNNTLSKRSFAVNRICSLGTLVCTVLFCFCTAQAADAKIAVLNIQDVIVKSSAGIAAKGIIEKRMDALKASLDKERQALEAFQEEMRKKASVWSEEKKQEQAIEFQKRRRDLGIKQDDANVEMKSLQDRHLAPIMQQLEGIVQDVARAKGLSMILPNHAVLYYDESIDITDEVVKALNVKMK